MAQVHPPPSHLPRHGDLHAADNTTPSSFHPHCAALTVNMLRQLDTSLISIKPRRRQVLIIVVRFSSSHHLRPLHHLRHFAVFFCHHRCPSEPPRRRDRCFNTLSLSPRLLRHHPILLPLSSTSATPSRSRRLPWSSFRLPCATNTAISSSSIADNFFDTTVVIDTVFS